MKPCLLCGSMQASLFFEKNGYAVSRCRPCHFAFVAEPPDRATLQKHYGLDYFFGDLSKFGYLNYDAERANRLRGFESKKRYIQDHAAPGLLLDVGCADGSFTSLLQPPWQTRGSELSKEMVERMPPTLRPTVFQGFFEDYPVPPELFDVLTLWDVIDHVDDPLKTLGKAHTLLKPGGLLGLNAGDMDSAFARLLGKYWYLFIPPTHLSYFSRRSITAALHKTGFRVEKILYEGKPVSLRLSAFRLRHMASAPGWTTTLQALEKRMPEWARIYINFFDVMTVWARRN